MKKIVVVLCALLSQYTFAEPSAEKQTEIRTMLKNNCSACHGVTLQGGMGPSLKPETLANKPDELLVSTILNGRKNTAMPSWKAFMNEDEIKWLVGILKSGH